MTGVPGFAFTVIDIYLRIMKLLSLLFSVLVFTSAAISLRAGDSPNIVFFFADDQTTSTLGCYGNPIVKTPNIDGLAARGVRFQNAFASQPICWVSRTSILTGLTGRSYGTSDDPEQTRADACAVLYPDLLRKKGYRTGFYGKWHAKMPKDFKPEDHFDDFEAIGRNPYYKKQADGTLRHETDLVVDRGIDFLKRQEKGKPFALNLWFNACHAEDSDHRPGIGQFPWPESANGLYEETEMYLPKLHDPAIFEALPSFFQTSITRERYFWRWNTDEKYQINMRSYLRMVSGIDNAIGRFLTALDEAGLSENTIIVYSADNGYHMANRGLAGKWSHFEESIRVPLIITDPRVAEQERGKVTEAMALNLDLPSTFLHWAGAEIPNRYQGKSLKSIIEGPRPSDWRTWTFHEHFAVRNRIPAFEGIRTDRFKYARYFDEGNYEFLYDLKADPDELTNLASDASFADTLKSLREQTTAVVTEYGGPLDPRTEPFTPSTEAHPVASAAIGANLDSEGFMRVFDGKSLKGWSGDRQYWSVKEGAITGVTDGTLKVNQFLTWTGSTIRNFEIRVKVKVTVGGNSGIQYRGLSRPEIGLDVVSGYQCDVVANTPEYNGMLYEERGRRILSHTGEKVIIDQKGQPWITGKMEVKVFAPDEWHDYRVLVEGNHHRHWIDGHPTADLIDFDETGRRLEGVLAVQVHVGPAMQIQYKDFRVKNLPDELPLMKESDHPIPTESTGVKPQGKLPADWKPPIFRKP